MSGQPTGGVSDQPTAQFGSSDRACRIRTDTPVGTTDTELNHQNITNELSPPTGRGGGSLNDYFPGEEISAWAAAHKEFPKFGEEHPLGLDPLDPEIVDDFKDWYRAQGRSSEDWNASYKRWLRRELRYRTSGRKRPRRNKECRSMLDAALDEVRKAEAIDG